MSSSGHTACTKIEICFGFETALRIARATGSVDSVRVNGGSPTVPNRAPSKQAVEAALEHMELSNRELHLTKPVHVIAGSGSRGRASATHISHRCTMNLSKRSLLRFDTSVSFANPALAFIQMATQEKSMVALLELGFELCGTYQTKRTAATSEYNVEPLLSTRILRTYLERNPSLRGSNSISRVMRYLADGSASARETKQALMFGLPKMYGGYALGIPRMNYKVVASRAAHAISGRASFRCDLCWPEAKLDVEYQSRESHEGEVSRIRDSRRANALVSMGWTVIGVTNDELDSFAATETIANTIRRHLGKRTQIHVSDYHARKLKLRRQLGLPLRYE